MEEKQDNREIRDEINKIKEQMTEILKALQALEKKNTDKDVSGGNIENQATHPPTPHPHGFRIQHLVYPTGCDGQNFQAMQWP